MSAVNYRRVRMMDIANEVGCSVPVVAKVLSGGNSTIRVSKATASKVREVAQRLQYRPNLNAKALAGGKTRVIGVLIDSQASGISFRILEQVEKQAAAAGYRILIGEAHDSVRNLCDCFDRLSLSGVDGLLVLASEYPGQEQELRQFLLSQRSTVVLIGENCVPELPLIAVNRRKCIQQAVRALQERHCRRIGTLVINRETAIQYNGFRQVNDELHRLLGDFPVYNLQDNEDKRDISEKMREAVNRFIVPEKLDAVFAPNDLYAAALLRELAIRKIRVPEDLAVIGWDDDAYSSVLSPSLSTVNEHVEQIGIQAFELLRKLIEENGVLPENAKVEVEAEFIRRESV